jgi:hypothetical protein
LAKKKVQSEKTTFFTEHYPAISRANSVEPGENIC